jgi:hypothetical protein
MIYIVYPKKLPYNEGAWIGATLNRESVVNGAVPATVDLDKRNYPL